MYKLILGLFKENIIYLFINIIYLEKKRIIFQSLKLSVTFYTLLLSFDNWQKSFRKKNGGFELINLSILLSISSGEEMKWESTRRCYKDRQK